jgi:Mrp family chromosome partitioning ATPase
VLDAMLRGRLNGHIVQTGFPRLSILPAGEQEAQEVSRLSPSLVRRLLDAAKSEYDVVVVDTGPILGSLEASLVSAEADGVVLALGRGQQRFQVERAVSHLSSVGAKLIGVVFNRARPNDFKRAVSSASVRSVPVSSNGQDDVRRMPALGPMARTVASHIHAGENDDL